MAKGMAKGRRRGNGEGSVSQRTDGRWETRISLDVPPWRKSFYFRTEPEAIQKLKEVHRDVLLGRPVAPERHTLARFMEWWLENSVKPNLAPSTYSQYSIMARCYISPTLGKVELAKLTPQQVSAFHQRLRTQVGRKGKPLSKRSIQVAHDVLSIALEQAVRQELIPRNPARQVDRPRAETPPTKFLEPEQAKKLIEALKEDRLKAMYVAAIAMGLRKGEVLALKWEDLDVERGLLKVQGNLQRIEGKLVLGKPKTKKSAATASVPQIALAALRDHRIRQLEERFSMGPAWRDTGHVFTTTVGTPIDPRSVNRHLDQLLAKVGLPHVTFHGLRHSMATLAMAAGVPREVIMKAMRHSQSSMTWLYMHLYPELQQEVSDAMDRMLGWGA